ncbi:uncharacterized protein LOC144488576 [Mustelus asterias]
MDSLIVPIHGNDSLGCWSCGWHQCVKVTSCVLCPSMQILERLIQRCRQVQSLDPEQELKDIKLAMIDMQEQIQNLCYSNKQNNTIARIKRGRSIECTRKELMVKHTSNASDSDTDTW